MSYTSIPAGVVAPNDILAGVAPGTTSQADWIPGTTTGTFGAAAGTGTGQQGIAPLASWGAGTIGDAFASVRAWLDKPFTTPMSASTIFILIGVVLVSVIAWNLILYHIRLAAAEI